MEIIEVCRIVPSRLTSAAPPPPNSLPLTFFDLRWVRLSPSQGLYFYEIPAPPPNPRTTRTDTTAMFLDEIVPRLKRSLSLALGHHFLALGGELTWPLSSPKPVLGLPEDDGCAGVSFTVAKTRADFDRLSSIDNLFSDAADFHPLVPSLPVSRDRASVVAVQVTVFPDGGFSVGTAMNHAVLDGKSFTSFVRSWAHISGSLADGDHESVELTPELKPSYERALIKDPLNLGELYADNWRNLHAGPENRSVEPSVLKGPSPGSGSVRATFHFPQEKIQKVRRSAIAELNLDEKARVSTFSLVSAFALVRLVEAEEIGEDRIVFLFGADCRSRLDPPLPPTYVGNCVVPRTVSFAREALLGREGFCMAMKAINEAAATGFESDRFFNGAEKWAESIVNFVSHGVSGDRGGGYNVVSSPRFEVYKTDFGWGRPRRVEVVSIDIAPGAICLSDNQNSDGVEIGLVLKKPHMEAFASMFAQGLASLS